MALSNPNEELKNISTEANVKLDSETFAHLMDNRDSLSFLREKFHYPKVSGLPNVDFSLVNSESDCIYLCGNSLGLMPKCLKGYLERVTDGWATLGVYGHFDGEFPWALCDELVNADSAKLVGAKTDEVAVMNGLTVNLHLLLIAFYQPIPARFKILLEKNAFPSDYYAFQSQARINDYDPKDVLIELIPRQGESTLRMEDIIKVIQEQGDQIAVVCLSGVQYYTGQFFDIETITKVAQEKGCYVGWDLAHAVGNVELYLHDWNVDFACWCSYKYLNSGAGGIAGAFLHERHDASKLTKLQGWWSHKIATRFDMANKMEESSGISSFRLTNPSMLQTASLRASLDVFNEAGGMKPLRQKSVLLTAYLETLLHEHFFKTPSTSPENANAPFKIITPENTNERGAQLSLVFPVSIASIHEKLIKRGVVCDERKPNVLRVAPVPLYNSFSDVFRFVQVCKEVFV